MGKRKTMAIAAALALGAAGCAAFADDLLVPLDGAVVTATPPADYAGATVRGPLKIDGAGVSVTNTGRVSIGPDVGDNASVVVTNGAFWRLTDNAEIVYGANGGRGGTVTVAGDPGGELAWYEVGRCGTFGGHVVHCVDANLDRDAAEGVFDLADMREKGWLGFKQIWARNARIKTRLLFNGGGMCTKTGGAPLFQADENAEIVLEGCGGAPLFVKSLWGGSKTFFSGAGRLTVRGKGALWYTVQNSPERTVTSLGAGVNWENDGGLVLDGRHSWLKTTAHDVLPFERGGVTLTKGYGLHPKTGINCVNVLDLNGTTQRVCNLVFADGTSADTAFVTNSSPTRAVLEIGEHATGTIALNGSFGGKIDLVVKGKTEVVLGANFKKTDEVRLTRLNPALHNARFETVMPGDAWEGTLTVSNWCENVAEDPGYVKNGARRDRAPSLVKTLAPGAGRTVDVRGGALGVAQFAGAAGARVHVRPDCELSVRAQAPKAVRFLRLVLKEAYGVQAQGADGKFYPLLKSFLLVAADGKPYWPGDVGYARLPADATTAEMAPGTYKFHSDKYAVGKSADLDKVNVPYVLSDDYTFGPDSFLRQKLVWGGLLFTNAVPCRAAADTWHVVTLRLKDDAPAFVGYRFCLNWHHVCDPLCWAVEGSADGVSWATLDEKTDYYPFRWGNRNAGSTDEGYNQVNASMDGRIVFPFFWTRGVADAVRFDLGGATLRVDRGGVLDVSQTGRPAEVAALEIDAQEGGGRVTCFMPAKGGVLRVVNAAQAGALAASERTLAFAFDELVAPGNFDSWKVVVNGVPCTSVRVGATKDGLKLFDRGFLVLVR